LLYGELLRASGCGPLDDGCVVFAQSLLAVFGGQMRVTEGATRGCKEEGLRAQHPVVQLPEGSFLDADGWAQTATSLLQRWTEREGSVG
jgi:hypothetical protein